MASCVPRNYLVIVFFLTLTVRKTRKSIFRSKNVLSERQQINKSNSYTHDSEDWRAEWNCQPPSYNAKAHCKTDEAAPSIRISKSQAQVTIETDKNVLSNNIPRIWNRRDPKDLLRCLTRTNSHSRKEAVPKSAVVLQNRGYPDL